MSRLGRTISITGGDGAAIGCYHANAKGTRRGGLIVIQEVFGVTDHIRDVADSYAAEGFEVLAPQLFDRMEKDFEATYSEADIERSVALSSKAPWDTVQADVQTCIDRLKDKGPVYITGYCYGGSVVWLAACRCTGLNAGSSYYGRRITELLNETPKCPVILHYGKHDKGIPLTDVERVRAAHPDVPIYLYDAGHGFNSDRRDDYDADCAALARQRTLELFEANN